MGRYGNTVSESCVETKKHLKQSLKDEKKKLKDFFAMTAYIDMPWEARQQTIGSICVNILEMKKRLKGK